MEQLRVRVKIESLVTENFQYCPNKDIKLLQRKWTSRWKRTDKARLMSLRTWVCVVTADINGDITSRNSQIKCRIIQLAQSTLRQY